MFGEVFLIILGLIWIGFATIQDLKKREIANWLNFSLIIFALGFRFFYSLFSGMDSWEGFSFFYQGMIGLIIFFILGNLLYYGRIFAGGDAKLFIALGVILPFSKSIIGNLNIFIGFFILFLIIGALYGIIVSSVLGIRNHKKFKKEFLKQFNKKKRIFYLFLIMGVLLIGFAFIEKILFYLAILIFISPYLYIAAKSIDEVCMIKKVKSSDLTEGDWLYKNLRIGKKVIKTTWNGLSKEDINFIKKHKKQVLIRQGIPFTPVFLISFLILMFAWAKGLLYSFW